MTDKEKLQKLFDAALKDSSPPTVMRLTRAVPSGTASSSGEAAGTVQDALPAETRHPAADTGPTGVQETMAPAAVAAPGSLDQATTAELGSLLDEKIRRQKLRRRRGVFITAIVFFGLLGGGSAWFVQSPQRVEALTTTIREIRSASDIKSIIAKYQVSLDKISVRSKQLEQSTSSMGVKHTAADEKDPDLNAEMKQMMGGDGTTVGERNTALRKSFDNKPTPGIQTN